MKIALLILLYLILILGKRFAEKSIELKKNLKAIKLSGYHFV
jgi:hypothetical protein